MVSSLDAREMLAAAGYSPDKVDTFITAHAASPEVWQTFERITLGLISAGKKAGAIDVLGRARWETHIEGGKDWKVNNNYAPYYARIFAAKYPEHCDFFEFRKVRGYHHV
jgi:hypothetical protein